MKKLRISLVFSLIACSGFLVGYVPNALGQSDSAHSDPVKGRALRLSLSSATFTGRGFEDVERSGFGVASVYQFVLNPQFLVGIDLSLRQFPGDQALSQIGYGLVLEHKIPSLAFGPFVPFVDYGLLLQVLRLQGLRGDGTAHDTKLAVGAEFAERWFFEVGYHISKLRYFEAASVQLNYLELNLGWYTHW